MGSTYYVSLFKFYKIVCEDSFLAHFFVVVIPSEVRIEGLETMDYFDNLSKRERFTEQGDAITFESEVNLSTSRDGLA